MHLRPLTCQNRCTFNFLCLKIDAQAGVMFWREFMDNDGHNLFPRGKTWKTQATSHGMPLGYGPLI